jgi:hypothetical protein
MPCPEGLRALVAMLDTGPPSSRVQCVLLAGSIVVLAEVDPEDLADAKRAKLPYWYEEFGRVVERCKTQEGALMLVRANRLLYRWERSGTPFELAALEHVVERRWDDLAALRRAVARALAAPRPMPATRATRRMLLVLTVLAQVLGSRAQRAVNARGGVA